ncbi:Fe-S cluster assembly protein SufD [Geothrix rubra]|uniref:Fe-S cluster assembly protein SufD n=1 Tax=Geothrix rubra TaxID=2927977 RepID=A0ABQ5Q7B7_9BACT|nr:Fe-S cluster assembly protein SufD [Geothrix rubra]GLH70487.1 Fe-S cluster assembly protein SufD [Geothrix rubra]
MTPAVDASPLSDLLAGARPEGWEALRAAAEARLAGQALPDTGMEDWKYLDLALLHGPAFRPAAPAVPTTASADIQPYIHPEMMATRQVFVNGFHAPHASCATGLPPGVRFFPISAASEACRLLGTLGEGAPDFFEDLNTARFTEGAVLLVPQNVRVEVPLHLLFLSRSAGDGTVPTMLPRLLVALDRGAELELVEEHHGEGTYLSCPVVEIRVAEGAILRHERIQRESTEAFHFSALKAEVARGGQYHSRTLSFGGRLSRQRPRIRLAEGAEATLDGLALLGGNQVADTHSFLHHAEPHGTSRQLHKCVVDGQARAIFNGQVRVAPGAQVTDAQQQSRNLLLSEKARVDTKPQLEIYADDVKCSHGAAVGQLDPDELFYLQSRGLDPEDARNLLTYGFAADLLARIPVASLRRSLRHLVLARTQAASLGDLA